MEAVNTENQTHVFDAGILRQYDIRGIVGDTLKEDDCYFVGKSFGTYMARKGLRTIVVGFDARESSKVFSDELIKGLVESGIDVCNIGLVPSPVVYYVMQEHKFDASIVITGSHSPLKYNGIKMTLLEGAFVGDEIKSLASIASVGDFAKGEGSVAEKDYSDEYVERILKDYNGKRDLKIAWDNGNGAGGEILRKLVAKMPGEHVVLYDEFDSNFPNHHPDPSVEKNLLDLIKAVKDNGCDIGIAFDGDADRIGVVDEQGNIIWSDILLAVYASEVLAEHPGETVIADVKCSRVLFDEIGRLGGNPVISMTGAAMIRPQVKELNAPLAGELSGHIIFNDKYYGFDDGVYCGLRIANLLSNSGRKMSELVAHLPKTVFTPELRLEVEASRKFLIPTEIKDRLVAESNPNIQVNDIDGVRVTTPEGWWLVRASNTEELITLRVEAFDEEGLEKLKAQITKQLRLSNFELKFD